VQQDDCFENEDIYSKQFDQLFFLRFLQLGLMYSRIMGSEDHHDDFIIRLKNANFA